MAIDPQMQAVLESLADFNAPPPNTLPAKEARKGPTPADAVKKLLTERGQDTTPKPVGRVTEITIPTSAGDLQARTYAPSGDGPFPVIVYFHGGGWVIADLDVYDSSPRALCNAAKAMVVSVHYRQAPEDPYPAAHDDALAAYEWVTAHAADLGGDPDRVAIVGESAGGNLAISTSLRVRDSGGTLPVHQVLAYPISGASFDTPSYVEHANAKPLSRDMMIWFWDNYAPDPESRLDPYLTPVNADLAGMPPTTIILAEIDPLRSEGEVLAERLKRAGVQTTVKTFMGVTHEFFGTGAAVAKAKEAVELAGSELRAAFGTDVVAVGPGADDRSQAAAGIARGVSGTV